MMKAVRIGTLLAALAALVPLVLLPSPRADLKLARSAYWAGDLDQALRLARRAVALGRGGSSLRLQSLALQARAARKLGRPDMALAYLDRVLALDPKQARAYLLRGSIRLGRGDRSGALADLDRGLELAGGRGQRASSSLAPYYARRGLANLALGRLGPARRDAGLALAANPRVAEGHQLSSLIEEKGKNWPGALEAAETAFGLAQQRNRYFFMTPQGKKWLKRLVWLRMKNKVNLIQPTRRY